MERARKATLKMIAASDGAPQSPSGYSFYLLAHAIATVLLLITLVAAIWQFMDWVASPSCDGPAALSSVSSSPAASPAAAQTASYRPARAEMARRSGDCPCPEGR